MEILINALYLNQSNCACDSDQCGSSNCPLVDENGTCFDD